jgi:hypothetical protein
MSLQHGQVADAQQPDSRVRSARGTAVYAPNTSGATHRTVSGSRPGMMPSPLVRWNDACQY